MKKKAKKSVVQTRYTSMGKDTLSLTNWTVNGKEIDIRMVKVVNKTEDTISFNVTAQGVLTVTVNKPSLTK